MNVGPQPVRTVTVQLSEIARWPEIAFTTLKGLPNFRIETLARLDIRTRDILQNVIADQRLRDLEFEHLLTSMRRTIRDQVVAGASSEPVRSLLCALAIQAYRHGFPFAQFPDEHVCNDAFVRACYAPLKREVSGRKGDIWIEALNAVHIQEPRRQQALQRAAKSLGEIADDTSQKVRAQYEEHPYPAWWERLAEKADPVRRGAMLVAGCGTGRHPIIYALRAPNMEITAVDISRASLGYGMRRAKELGVNNIEWVHGDLVDIAKLGRTFEEISSIGVLHHMRRPEAGLAALAEVLKPGGEIEIALYIESCRQSVVAAIALRDKLGMAATPDGIRAFRQIIAGLPPDDLARKVSRHEEFFSLQSCRDLLFHPQEHRYDFPKLKALIASCGLKLVSLDSTPELRQLFQARFPGRDPLTDLDAWNEIEADIPSAFRSMYHVHLRRE